jgi:hypothetical protein
LLCNAVSGGGCRTSQTRFDAAALREKPKS